MKIQTGCSSDLYKRPRAELRVLMKDDFANSQPHSLTASQPAPHVARERRTTKASFGSFMKRPDS